MDWMTAGWNAVPNWLAHARAALLVRSARQRLRSQPRPYRLCLGSGQAPIDGWTNVDLYFPADIRLDLRSGIPAPDGSARFIYSEHLFEHLSLQAAMLLFAECRRVLASDGVMRIAMPDLADLAHGYNERWREHEWVRLPEYGWIDSGPRMLNTAFRAWGHIYLYDFQELQMRLTQAGFTQVTRCEVGRSSHEALRGLETRADSRLIAEASLRMGAE